MEREAFAKVMQEVLDSLPEEFRDRIRNVAVLVEDYPPGQTLSSHPKKLLLGLFHGVPMTKKSVFDLPTGPDYVVLYQKNIEAVCSTEAEIRRANPAHGHPRVRALFRNGRGATEGCLAESWLTVK